jgi:hypothetical protein
MSCVTGFVLVYSHGEGNGNLLRINAWLSERRFSGLVELAEKHAVGGKYPELNLFAAGYNYFLEDEFISFFRTLRWQSPERCVLSLSPEEGATRVVRPDVDTHDEDLDPLSLSSDVIVRFELHLEAWNAAIALVDHKAQLRKDLRVAEAEFLQSQTGYAVPEAQRKRAFLDAVAIAQCTERFRRSECPQNSPKLARRYELLLALARHLEAEFPDADPLLVQHACRGMDMYWDH